MKALVYLLPLLLIIGCGKDKKPEKPKVEPSDIETVKFPVIVESVSGGSIQKLLKSQGRIEAKRIAYISPQVNGRIAKHFYEEGQKMNEGDLMIQLSTPPGVELAIEKLRLRISQSNLKLSRQQTLLKNAPDAIAKSEIEETELSLQEQKLDLMKQLEEASLRAIRAPFSGVITEKSGELGQQIGPNTNVAKLLDVSSLRVSLDIPESRLQELRMKQVVHVELLSDKTTAKGSISALPSAINEKNGSGRVIINLQQIPSHWRVGSFVTIEFQMAKFDAPRIIPRSAIRYKQNRPYVWIAIKKGERTIAHRSWVDLGEGDRDRIIVSRGIKVGDLLVTKGQRSLSDEMELEISDKQPATSNR